MCKQASISDGNSKKAKKVHHVKKVGTAFKPQIFNIIRKIALSLNIQLSIGMSTMEVVLNSLTVLYFNLNHNIY